MKIECAPGIHSVNFAYKDGTSLFGKETITVEVKSGLETKVIGYIDGTGSSGSSESQTTVMQPIEVKQNEATTVSVNVAPVNSEQTIVTFPAGSFTADFANAVLNLSVKSAGEFTVTSTSELDPVAGIDISLLVDGNEVSSFNNQEVVIETYILKGLENVDVKYTGDGIHPAPITVTTSATSSVTGNYYEKDTGKLVFSTPHFSEFFVWSNAVCYDIDTNTAYATLADAINAVPENVDGTTNIKVLRDVTNAEGLSVASGKNFVVDFNGHTYTIVGPGAGSANTETNGFQFLRDSTITLRNGKINLSKSNNTVYRVIQNYANLTLEDLEIDATNQYYYKDYVISFNCGTNKIVGNTSIYTNASSFNPDTSVIFEVDDWADGGYHGVNLTIDTTGDIRGVVKVNLAKPGDTCGSYFKLTNGNVNKISIIGGVVNNLSDINTPNIVITGGEFSTDPSQYVAEYYTAVPNEENTSWTVRKMTKEELANAGYVARYYNTAYYKSISEAFSNHGGGIYLMNNVEGSISRTGYVQLYCEDYTFEGTISCTPTPDTSGNVSIYTGTAILNNIECSSTFYCGSSSNSPSITIKDGSINNLEARKNAKVIIEGGTYTGTIKLNTGGNGSLTIKGGTFSADPTIYVPEGYAATFNGQTWEVSEQSN